jgi:flagellar motility protein MotE (MotC chaperone)
VAPGMFGVDPAADSTAVASGDSLHIAPGDSLDDSAHISGTEVAGDPLALAQAEIERLKAENDSLRALTGTPRQEARAASVELAVTRTDSVSIAGSSLDSKGAAKMIEAMTPESAAKVLVQLTSDEAKKVIRGVKARQAGKILALLPPDRAAHLMR